jgi:putative tryptophan/tyrosine transport system substrate-binding protein
MTKGLFGFTFSAMLLALCSFAEAQQSKKIPRIGYVSVSGDAKNPGRFVEAFRQGLRDIGYIEGKNIVVEYRYPGSQPELVPGFVAELVQLKVDMLVSSSTGALKAAKEATKTIPIVMITSQDPVATGMVESLARPGANITGVTRLTQELSGKRLELFKEVVPQISRVGILAGTGSSSLPAYEPVANALKISLDLFEVGDPSVDLAGAFQTMLKKRLNGLITVGSRRINPGRKQILEFVAKNRLPSMFEVSSWVDSGGLVSYSADDLAAFRRAAVFVDKILKGTKPADLPVEQPQKFEFVINLITAKQIGLTVPPNVLARADRVIK